MAVLTTIKAFIFGTLLSLNQMPDLDMKEVSCLTEAIYFEAGSEPYQGKVAVGNVILNRVKQSAFKADTVCEVLAQKKQFSYQWTHKGANKRKIDIYDDRQQKILADSMKVSIGILSGTIGDNTNGSTHFLNRKVATYTAWTNNLRKTAVIGQHTFYAFKSKPKTTPEPQRFHLASND